MGPRRTSGILHPTQQLTVERAMFAPIMDDRTLRGAGPRMAEHMLDSMPWIPFPACEDIRLKGQSGREVNADVRARSSTSGGSR